MAQVVVGAVGAVVGFYVGGPTGAYYGYAIASTLYAVTRPGPHSEGPRLTDLKTTGTNYGRPLIWVAGHPRVPSDVIWASDKRPIATTSSQGGGKGSGPTYTEYSYEVDLLLEVSDNVIAGVARCWDNGKFIWSKRTDAPAGTIEASNSTDRWRRMTVYTGEETQLPDPTYEAAVGVGRAPAYRGRGTIFIEGLQLGQSGQLPNLTWEAARLAETGPGEEVGKWTFATPTTYGNGAPVVTAFKPNDTYLVHQILWDATYANDDVSVYACVGDTATLVGGYEVITNTDTAQRGQSDVSGLFVRNGSTLILYFAQWNQIDGFSHQTLTYGLTATDDGLVCKLGNAVYFASTDFTAALRRFDLAHPTATAVNTSTAAAFPTGIASDGAYVYLTNGATVYVYDGTSLALVDSFATPAGMTEPELYCDGGELILFDRTPPTLYKRASGAWEQFSTWTKIDGGTEGASQALSTYVDGVWFRTTAGFDPVDGTLWRVTGYQAGSNTIDPQDETLQSVVAALLLRAGFDDSEFDVSALSVITKPVRALAITQVGATRATLELLMGAYFFECVLSDKLYFRPRAGASVLTIPFEDLGASNSQEGDPEPFSLKLRNELEVPAQIAVTYANVADDYQDGTEFSDRALTGQESTTAVQIALGFLPPEAKGIADAMVIDNIASLAGTTLKVPFSAYPQLEAADVVDVQTPDATYRMRLVTRKDSSGILEFDAVVDDAEAIDSAEITDENYIPQTEVQSIATTVWRALDVPILRDADNASGWYAAAKRGVGDIWPGAGMFRSWDGVGYDQVTTFTSESVFGVCTTTLGDWTGGNTFDWLNTLTVNVGSGTLSSSTRAAMLADLTVNVLLVGAEVIRFKTAALQSPGVYLLSGLIRGFRGTAWAISGHAASEPCALLSIDGLRRVADENSQIGVPSYVKAVTFNKPLSSAVGEAFTDTGVALKPFAPTDLRIARDVSGNITGSFKRQTRLSFRFLSPGIDPPIGEAIELYDVEIWDTTFTTLKRTFSALTSPTFTYSSADQVTDFGGNQSTVYVRVYQRSAVVGRGYTLQGAA